MPVSPQKELEPSHDYKIDYEKIKNLEEAKQKERVNCLRQSTDDNLRNSASER